MAGTDDLRPLDAAIDEIRTLREAAERAAARIAAEAHELTGSSGTEGLVADIAEALVARTETMREDCARLDGLLHRARAALAATLDAPVATSPIPSRPQADIPQADIPTADIPPALAEPLPPLPLEPAPSYAAAPEPTEQPKEPPVWQFWHRWRRTAEEHPLQTPPRLPRPNWAAPGVGRVIKPEDLAARSRPPVPEGVRLIATQMAIAGSSRIEIERRLQKQFGIIDTDPALDEIFGYGSGALRG
jgi:hypothetical protein